MNVLHCRAAKGTLSLVNMADAPRAAAPAVVELGEPVWIVPTSGAAALPPEKLLPSHRALEFHNEDSKSVAGSPCCGPLSPVGSMSRGTVPSMHTG